MDTSDTGSQPPAQVQLTLPRWHLHEKLMPLEDRMLAKAAAGDPLDWDVGPVDLTAMQAWGEERTVRAAVLRHLLVEDKWPVTAKGVWLRGVRINGHLDLEGATLRCPLSLESCYLDASEPVCLDYATVLRLALTRCQLAGLTGVTLSARELDLSQSTLRGSLVLRGADITGRLNCSGAQLWSPGYNQYSLVADGLKIGAGVYLNAGFKTEGAIRLAAADITGQLNCSGAELGYSTDDHYSLFADRMKVSGPVYLADGFHSWVVISLCGADIAGQLSFSGARLGVKEFSLIADGLKVGGDVLLNAEVLGEVRLRDADIAGKLNCSGAQLRGHGTDGCALLANGLKVGGDVVLDKVSTTSEMIEGAGGIRLEGADIAGHLFCNHAQLSGCDHNSCSLDAFAIKVGGHVVLSGFTAAGTVSLNSAQVGGSVALAPAKSEGADEVAFNFDVARATAGTLVWKPSAQVSGDVSLEGTTVGDLVDNWSGERQHTGYWPTGGRLQLDGFTYGRFGGDQRVTEKQRLAWIRGQYQRSANGRSQGFATQPYEQLAAVYRQAGQDTQAREVAVARRADLRTYGNLKRYRKAGNWFLDKTIKYGYHTWRAAAVLAVAFVIFWALSFAGQHLHVIVPIGDIKGLHPEPSATTCTSNYPCFYPAGYTIDTVIPIINVHQADNWGPDGHVPWGWVWVVLTWLFTGLGWGLATLLVAGYTGLVRQVT